MTRSFSHKFRTRLVILFFFYPFFIFAKEKKLHFSPVKLTDKKVCTIYDYVLHIGDGGGHLSFSRCKIPQSTHHIVEHFYNENQEIFLDTGENTYFMTAPIDGDFPIPNETVEFVYLEKNKKEQKPMGLVVPYQFFEEGEFTKKTSFAVFGIKPNQVCLKGVEANKEKVNVLLTENICLESIVPKEKNSLHENNNDVWLSVINDMSTESIPFELPESDEWEYPIDPEISSLPPQTRTLIQTRPDEPYCCEYKMKVGTLDLKMSFLKQKLVLSIHGKLKNRKNPHIIRLCHF